MKSCLSVMLLTIRLKKRSSVVIGQFRTSVKLDGSVRFVSYVNVVNKSFVRYR